MRTIPLLVLLSIAWAGCGSAFTVSSPANFLELDQDHQRNAGYRYRATTADGVVLAVRVEKNEGHGTLAFWTQAVRNRLRRAGGYAVLEEKDVHAASGEAGHSLHCGRDESSHPFLYWVTLFVTDDRVFVVEAGGRREAFEAVQRDIESSLASFRIR